MKKIQLLASLFLVIGLLFGCSDDENNNGTPINQGESRLQLILVDAPGDYLEVNVEIIDIQYNDQEGDGGWQSLGEESDYPINVDLTELVAGNELLLADEVIPAGNLEQIRLILSENNTVVVENEDGQPETFPLNTPSAQQSGLKLKIETALEAGFTYTFILDWDVQQSVIEAGNSGNYNLRPVINVIAEVNSGSITGMVEDDQGSLSDVVVEIYDEADEYMSSTLTDANGLFLAQGLAAGNYKIKIDLDGFDPYVSPDFIEVVAGNVTDVGIIELIPE